MMDWDGSHAWGYMHSFGWVFGLLLWIVVIAALVVMVRRFSNKEGDNPTVEKSAFDILDERFARGEIDQQEYEQKRKVLKNNQ